MFKPSTQNPTSKASNRQGNVNLVIQTAFLGDLLLSVPFLKNMRKFWPDEKIVLVCRSGVGALLYQLGLVDSYYEVIKGDAESYKKLKKELSKINFHQIFCPHESLRSALLVSSLKAEKKIGFKSWWNFLFFDERIEKPKALPDALRQLSLLQTSDEDLKKNLEKILPETLLHKNSSGKLADVPLWATSSLRNLFLQSPKPKEFAFLNNGKKLVLIFPGSVWATKRWTPEGFLAVAQDFEKKNYQICWMGSHIEKKLCEELNRNLRSGVVLAGETSIFETCWLMAQSSLVIGNDSSSSHMASLTDTPVIAIFGPTTLDFGYRPWSSRAFISEAQLFCRPCGPHGHHQCPRGTHECMKLVTAAQVIGQADFILRNNP